MWRQDNDFIRSTVRHGTYIQPDHDEPRQAMSAPSLRPSAVARNALAMSSLPTVNSSRHNRRFSSPAHGQSRLCTSRRALFIGTATIVLLLFLGLHAHSSGQLPPTHRLERHTLATASDGCDGLRLLDERAAHRATHSARVVSPLPIPTASSLDRNCRVPCYP